MDEKRLAKIKQNFADQEWKDGSWWVEACRFLLDEHNRLAAELAEARKDVERMRQEMSKVKELPEENGRLNGLRYKAEQERDAALACLREALDRLGIFVEESDCCCRKVGAGIRNGWVCNGCASSELLIRIKALLAGKA